MLDANNYYIILYIQVKMFAVATLFLALFSLCNGANILAIFPMPSYSHQLVYQTLAQGLASRGHNVTVVSPIIIKNLCLNMTVIDISNTLSNVHKAFVSKFGENGKTMKSLTFWQGIWVRFDFGTLLSDIHFNSREIKQLLSDKQQFDLALLEYPFTSSYLGLIHHLGAPPVIGILSRNIMGGIDDFMGNFNNPAIVPNLNAEFTDHMNFGQRIINSVLYLFNLITYHYHHLPQQNEVMMKHFGSQTPSLCDLQRNVSIYLFSGNMASNYPKALTPNIVEIGPLHIAQTKALSQGLKDWVDGSDKGVVLFSMGTSVIVDIEVQKRIDIFFEAFSLFPEFRFLWKWSSNSLPGQPNNVLVQKWFPQHDIMAHSKTRAFIFQGGLQSTQEAMYFAVPVIGLPVQSDQSQNINKLVSSGAGVMLDVNNLNKCLIVQTLRNVLYNSSYKENMKKLSTILKDTPWSPLDKAIWWTEYVLRHHGADHLKPASLDLYWFQFILLDVIVTIFIVFIIIVLLIMLVLRKTFTIFRRKVKTE